MCGVPMSCCFAANDGPCSMCVRVAAMACASRYPSQSRVTIVCQASLGTELMELILRIQIGITLSIKLMPRIKKLGAHIKEPRAGIAAWGTSQDFQSRLGTGQVRSPSHTLPLDSPSQTSLTRPRNLKVVLRIRHIAPFPNHMAH